MRISVKSFTLASVGVLIVLLFVQASIAVYRMQSLQTAIMRVAAERLPDVRLLGDIDAQTVRYRVRLTRYTLVQDIERRFEIAAQMRLSVDVLAKEFAAYEATIHSDEQWRLWSDYKAKWAEYLDFHKRIVADAGNGNQRAAIDLIEASRDTFLTATSKLHAAIDHNDALTNQQLELAQKTFRDGILAIVAFAALAVAVGIGLAAFAVTKVSNPLVALTRAMRAIAKGDLAQEVPSQQSRNEIGDMAEALVVLRDGLAEAERVREVQRELDLANLRLMHETQMALNAHAERLDELVIEKTQHLAEREREIVWRLSRATERRDTDTGNHIARMSRISGIIAEALGLPKEDCRAIEIGAQMHDIGKVGIADDILFKPGKLTPEERQTMETHVLLGWDILNGSESLLIQTAAEIALSHHERWDGKGYPHGLAGEAIPISARIAAIADVFDALTSVRPYKRAWTIEETLAYVEENAGGHFDPACVAAFRSRLDDIAAIAGTSACEVVSAVAIAESVAVINAA